MYSSVTIIRMIKSRRMVWKFWSENLKGRDHLLRRHTHWWDVKELNRF